MRVYAGEVQEILLWGGKRVTRLLCPPQAVPAPGEFILAEAEGGVVTTPVFLAADSAQGFVAAPPVPSHWMPGLPLELRGPLGRGFHLPADVQKLALLALSDSAARLLPLAVSALERHLAVVLFADCHLPPLPYSLEAFPRKSLPEFLGWADFLAIDLPLPGLPTLRRLLGSSESLPCPAQALLTAPMPCGGIAGCGVCAVAARKGKYLLTCEDGPVFDLRALDW